MGCAVRLLALPAYYGARLSGAAMLLAGNAEMPPGCGYRRMACLRVSCGTRAVWRPGSQSVCVCWLVSGVAQVDCHMYPYALHRKKPEKPRTINNTGPEPD